MTFIKKITFLIATVMISTPTIAKRVFMDMD